MLIAGKIKLEEQCKSEQKNTLKLTALHDALLLANVNLKNELTLTMQNTHVRQETTSQFTADKK